MGKSGKFIVIVFGAYFLYKLDETAIIPALFSNMPAFLAFILSVVVVSLEIWGILKELASLSSP
jgi:hypothetical protein